MKKSLILTLLPAMLAVPAGVIAEEDTISFHLKTGGTISAWPWTQTDAAGFKWDVAANGYVSNGTNNAYSTAMQLRVNGTHFSFAGPGRVDAAGSEIELGPWRLGKIEAFRRVYVDGKIGYCRWIDIFHNSGETVQDLTIDYSISLGSVIRGARTSSDKTTPSPEDWAVAITTGNGSRPGTFHAFGTSSAKIRPKVRFSTQSNVLSYHFRVRVKPGSTFAICLFEAQRPYDKAVAMLERFHPATEMRKVPPELRRSIVNMGSTLTILGTFAVARDETSDTVVLVNGDELLGKLLNESYKVQGALGTVTLGAARVLGLQWPDPGEPFVRIGLGDGQVLAGTLTSGPVRLQLPDGNVMDIPHRRVRTVGYQLSDERPTSASPDEAFLVLRDGQRLVLKADSLDLSFQAASGLVRLSPEALSAIYLDTPEGGLHRAVFRNGSVLSGLLTAPDIKTATLWAPATQMPRAAVSTLVFRSGAFTDLPPARITLGNDDVLRGRVAQETLTVATGSGKITVKTDTIATATFNAEAFGRVQITLHGGTKVTGVLEDRTLAFQIDPGPKVQIFAGHLRTLVAKTPPESPPAKVR